MQTREISLRVVGKDSLLWTGVVSTSHSDCITMLELIVIIPANAFDSTWCTVGYFRSIPEASHHYAQGLFLTQKQCRKSGHLSQTDIPIPNGSTNCGLSAINEEYCRHQVVLIGRRMLVSTLLSGGINVSLHMNEYMGIVTGVYNCSTVAAVLDPKYQTFI